MSSSISSLTNSVMKSLEKINIAIENLWCSSLGLTKEINVNDFGISLRKMISYNPSTENIEEAKIKDGVNTINEIIQTTVNEIEKNPENFKHWILLGHCYLTLSDMPNAYSAYAHALTMEESEDDSYFLYGLGCVNQYFKFKIGKIYFQKALKHEIESNDLLLRYALALRKDCEYNQSIEHLESLLKSPPNCLKEEDIKLQIAFTYQLSGNKEKSSSLYKELFSIYPNNLLLLQQYTWFLSLSHESSDLNEAIKIIEESFPDDPTLLLTYARIKMKRNDMIVAYQKFCKCILYWSSSSLFWCALGILYLKNGQKDDAIVAFQRSIYLKSDLQEAWLNLGLIYELSNDQTNTTKIYEIAIQNCPDSAQLKDRLNTSRNLKTRNADLNMIEEICDSKLFVQPAESIVNQYISNPPQLPIEVFHSDKINELFLKELKVYHISSF